MANVIERGQVYWLKGVLDSVEGNGIAHPHLVLQETAINRSRIGTVVVCALSTNMSRAYDIGNVLLELGEGGLEKRSFIAVGQVSTVPITAFDRLIGELSEERVKQVLEGIVQRDNAIKRETS